MSEQLLDYSRTVEKLTDATHETTRASTYKKTTTLRKAPRAPTTTTTTTATETTTTTIVVLDLGELHPICMLLFSPL